MRFKSERNNKSLKEIYSIYFDDLFVYAKTITNSSDLAKDAVSDVFMYLLRSKTDLNYVRDVQAYLLKSVKNSAIKIVSRNPVRLEYIQEDQEFQIAEEINPYNILLGKELEGFVHEAIKQLPPHGQLVFKMIRMNQRTYEEVAAELGISVNTVRNHLVAATKILRGKMKEFYAEKTLIKISDILGILCLLPLLDYL